jgi:LysR family transcriptional regulator, cys regulon transcriptional activator
MRIQQLKMFCAVIDAQFNISQAAQTQCTSQPGVSKQIIMLEQEVGCDLLHRQKGRISGLTKGGVKLERLARRILKDAEQIRQIASGSSEEEPGELVIATSHLHSRFILPPVFDAFRQRYPRVRLSLLQGNPSRCVELVCSGRADLGIINDRALGIGELRRLGSYSLPRVLIAPRGHPLLDKEAIGLLDLAEEPLIAYDRSFPGSESLYAAFAAAGIEPHVVVQAVDTDVIKTYVKRGVGVAVIPAVALDPEHDNELGARDVTELTGPSVAFILVHPATELRPYHTDFVFGLTGRLR